jgi:hypothetical protein
MCSEEDTQSKKLTLFLGTPLSFFFFSFSFSFFLFLIFSSCKRLQESRGGPICFILCATSVSSSQGGDSTR